MAKVPVANETSQCVDLLPGVVDQLGRQRGGGDGLGVEIHQQPHPSDLLLEPQRAVLDGDVDLFLLGFGCRLLLLNCRDGRDDAPVGPVVLARPAVDLLGDVLPVLDVRRMLGIGWVEPLRSVGVVPEERLVGQLRQHLVMSLVPLADHRLVRRVVGVELDRRIGGELVETELHMREQFFAGR